ncbi:DUF1836 domain-containing protein [Bacillus sp. 2205SS5-2]|uniref:DUF1836 domain-containing protein n=1 Tax=Bacillus sp. 2205SS5-2 TaxID=3109031 RepID=UPI003007605C
MKIKELELPLEIQLTLAEMPDIDLYMDQVIQLFEQKFGDTKRNAEEKILTKTMINNYAKGKVFFPIKNKKYSKEHLILISMIYQLKGSLSIGDIKSTLADINEIAENEPDELHRLYTSYGSVMKKNVQRFQDDTQSMSDDIEQEGESIATKERSRVEQILSIASLVHMSNCYRKAAEKLVDELVNE